MTIISMTISLYIVAILHKIHTLLCPLYHQHIASSHVKCLDRAVMVKDHVEGFCSLRWFLWYLFQPFQRPEAEQIFIERASSEPYCLCECVSEKVCLLHIRYKSKEPK